MGNTSVKQIICGIMFNHSFSILDDWGKIADSLLYSANKTPSFSPQYFPSISQQYTTSRFLSNEKAGHRLELTSNNLVYTHTIQSNFEKEYKEFVSRIEKYLIPQIIEKYALIARRIGMVYMCEMDCNSISAFKQQYFAKAASEITDCRFSIRSTAPAGLLFSGIDNYINKIYTVGGVDEAFQGISFDYQLYFQPPLPSISTKIIDSFFETSKKCFFEEILKEEYRGKH